MPVADTSLCVQTENAGEVNKGIGACCYVAVVDNVNLLTGELTVTFTTPPAGVAAQVVVPGENIRYNCGLCYTAGLGTNLPAMAFNREDSVLVLIPRGWVPSFEGDVAGLYVVGHEFANGVEDQKACGQMGRMIIQPGENPAGLNGYGTPFLEETVDDAGLPVCVPVNPFFDPYLFTTVGKGTLNGTGRHLMVYGNGEDLVAVRPYLFPDGADFNGTLELTHFVSDALFPYGLRYLAGTSSIVTANNTATLSISNKLQEPRSIGTNVAQYTNAFVFTPTTGVPQSSTPVATPLSPQFAITEDGIYIRNGAGIYKYAPTIDTELPSITYSGADPSNAYVIEDGGSAAVNWGYDYVYDEYSVNQFTGYPPYYTVQVGYTTATTETVWRPLSSTTTVLHDGVNTVKHEYSYTEEVSRDEFSYYDTQHSNEGGETTITTSWSNIASTLFNGVELGKNGIVGNWTQEYTNEPGYDGSGICSNEGDPPIVTPEVTSTSEKMSGTITEYSTIFVFLDVANELAMFITCEWTDTITNEDISGPPVFQPTATFELKLYNRGVVTVLDSLDYDYTPHAWYWAGGTYPVPTPNRPGWSISGASYTYVPPFPDYRETDSGTTWGDPAGPAHCGWTSQHDAYYYNTTSALMSPVACLLEVSRAWNTPHVNELFSGFTLPYCPIRLMRFISNYFNEFAKSDDGNLMYFSVRKLAAIAAATTGDDDYIRVLVNNGEVSLDAKTILEAATGLTHAQAGLRFAPV